MRTTINIDETLLEELKRRADEEGTTVSRLIEDSVRFSATRTTKREPRSKFKLVTYGKGGLFTPFDIDRTSSLVELEDVERAAHRR